MQRDTQTTPNTPEPDVRLRIVPTMEDAQRTAAVLAALGAGEVVLFGSVARGHAEPGSDIDLIVIYDDLDYNTRNRKENELVAVAGDYVDCRLDLYVIDRPEWKMRTRQVVTSFQRWARLEGTVLHSRPPSGPINWDKKMVLPTSDYQQALSRLPNIDSKLREMASEVPDRRFPRRESDTWWAEDRRQGWKRGCRAAHDAIELSIKALINLAADPDKPAWGKDIRGHITNLPRPHQTNITSLLEPIGIDNLSRWHEKAHRRGHPTGATQQQFLTAIEAACSTASYTASQFNPELPKVEELQQTITSIHNLKDHYHQHLDEHPDPQETPQSQ
ncbi:MAG: nucleotidyltransferase domain-containing protein [bacterium]|nr:nucleotidyltransferase domain-containing protein [bacterium]